MRRDRFHEEYAEALARGAGTTAPLVRGSSRRFASFADDETYTMVAGRLEKQHVDLMLAYGLRDAEGRRLRLVLPEHYAGATLHRAPWLRPDRRPEVFVYHTYGATPEPVAVPSRTEVIESYDRFKGGLDDEYRRATLPLHLGDRVRWVREVVDWLAAQHELDPGHRQGQRAWHCRGQKMFEIRSKRDGLLVIAGVQAEGRYDRLMIDSPLTRDQLHRAQFRVREGITQRLEGGGDYHRADEHWMQAVIRRNPRLVGLEMTSLREVPAWRRRGPVSTTAKTSWGRGYIDLLGIDATGTIQVVETKLAAKNDPMIVLQALDYLVFCEAYRRAITRRLDVVSSAPMAIRLAIGSARQEGLRINRFVPGQLDAVDDSVEWSVTTVTNWFRQPREPEAAVNGPLGAEEVGVLAGMEGSDGS